MPGADPTPEMVTTALNDYNVAVQLRVWLKNEKQHLAVRFELREKIYRAMLAAGVDMPLQTIQLAPVELRGRAAAGPAAPNG